MESGSGRGLAVTSVAACALLVFGGASAAATRVPSPAAPATSSSWGDGVEAVLPANAAATQQSVVVRFFSCPSPGNCSAAGAYTDSAGHQQLVLFSEKAGVWAPGVQAELPADADASQIMLEIDAMSCPSAGECSAVGSYTVAPGDWRGLLLTETGGTWLPGTEAPLPANAWSHQMVGLLTISCVSAGNCTAVGSYFANGPGGLSGLLLTETEGTWATGVEATLPADGLMLDPPVGLVSVSCASAGNCAAAGSYLTSSGSRGLVLTERAGSWEPGLEVQPPSSANPPADAYLYDISCPSVGNCSATGSYSDASGNQEGLLLTESAGTWSPAVEAVLPSDAATTQQRASISPLSCPSAGECGAVGSYVDTAGDQKQMLLTETGGTWSAGAEPVLPANAATTKPQGLIAPPSCPSAGHCITVGSYTDSSGNSRALLLTETAGSWSPSEALLPANAATSHEAALFPSVVCPSTGNCGAVGSYIDSSGNPDGLLLTETSGTWEAEEAPLPANAKTPNASPGFNLISCPTPGSCSAAGTYADDSSGGGPAILLLGGSPPAVTVDVATTGTGSGAVFSGPEGIDCGSTCSASFEAGTSLTLTATPSPGSRFTGWSGGGCTGTGSCQVSTGISEQTVTAEFSPPAKPKCVVPRVKGKTLKAARRAIRTHHCAVGRVKRATSRKVKRGHVISEKPGASRRLADGAKIRLVVSKGRR